MDSSLLSASHVTPHHTSFDSRSTASHLNASGLNRTSNSQGLDAVLESQFALADQQTVNLMQENVSQVHVWKLETEKKERMMGDLRRQIDDLLPLKEEVGQWKLELWLAEERLRLKEGELKQLHTDHATVKSHLMNTESTLMAQLQHKEEEIAALHQMHQEKVDGLEARLRSLEAETSHQDHSRALMGRELAELTATAQAERKLSSEREHKQREISHGLQAQVTAAQAQLHEALHKLAMAEQTNGNLKQDLSDSTVALDQVRAELEAARNALTKGDEKLKLLSNTNQQLSDTVESLRLEANVSHQLRLELAVIPSLQEEVRTGKEQIAQLEAQAERVRRELRDAEQEAQRARDHCATLQREAQQLEAELEQSRSAARDEAQDVRRVRDHNAELRQEVGALRAKLQSLGDPLQDLQESVAQQRQMAGHLEACRAANAQQVQELQRAADDHKRTEAKLDQLLQEVHAEVLHLHTAVDALRAGKRQPFTGPQLEGDCGARLKAAFMGLRSRIADASTQATAARDEQAILQQSLNNHQKINAALEDENRESQAQCARLKAKLDQQTAAHTALEEEVVKLTQACQALQQEHGAQQVQAAERSQGLLQSARGFADQLTALGSLVTETGPQGLPHISLALPGSGLTWDAVLRLTEDQMETARGALERVRGTVLALKDQQTGQERQLREAQAQLQQATERAEADAAASERVKAAALEEQRGRLTALHSGALDEALAARTKVEAEAEMLLSRLCALESAAEQLKLQNDGLVDQGEAQRGTAQQLQLNIEILSTDLTQKSEQCEFLTLDLERARAQTKELEDEMERVQEHATALQVQLEHVRGDNRELQDEVEKCHGQGTALQLQLDQLTLELQAVGAERDTGKQENHVLQSTVLSLQANLANLQEHDELQQISLGHLQDELRSVRDNSGALTVLVEQSKLMHSALQSRFDALQSTSHRQWDAIVLLARGWLWLGNQVKELRAQRTQFVHYAHTLYNALQAAAAEMRHIVPEPGQALLVKPLRSVALAVVAANRLRRLRRGAPGGHEQAVCTLTGGQRLGLAPESSVMACGLPDEAGAVEGPDGIAALTHLLTHLCSANALLDLSAMHTGPGPFRAGASRLPRSMTVALHLKAAATSVQHRLQSAEADAATHQRKHRALLEDCERHRAQLESLETVHTNRVRALEEAVQSKADLVRELERQEAAQRQRSEELQEALGAAEAELRGQTEALDKAVQARKGQTEQVDRLTKRLEGAQQDLEALQAAHARERDGLSDRLRAQSCEGEGLLEQLRAAAKELDDQKFRAAQLQHRVAEEEGRVQRCERALKRKEQTLESNAEMIKSLSGSHARVTQELANVQKELYEIQQLQQQQLLEKQHWTKTRLDNLHRRMDAENALQAVLSDGAGPPPEPAYALATHRHPSPPPARVHWAALSETLPDRTVSHSVHLPHGPGTESLSSIEQYNLSSSAVYPTAAAFATLGASDASSAAAHAAHGRLSPSAFGHAGPEPRAAPRPGPPSAAWELSSVSLGAGVATHRREDVRVSAAPRTAARSLAGALDGSRGAMQQHYRDIQMAISDIDSSLQRTLQTSALSSIPSRDSTPTASPQPPLRRSRVQ